MVAQANQILNNQDTEAIPSLVVIRYQKVIHTY
jgi:hypothetical protein